jgi:hypothetical protein
MRSLTAATQAALNASETGEVFLVLLTIAHPDMTTKRFVNNTVSVTSRGNVFDPYPFDAALPDDTDDEPMRAILVIDNVDRALVEAIRSITTPPTITIEIVRAAAPDTVEASAKDCILRNVTYNQLVIQGDLSYEDLLNEPFPRYHYTPNLFPGLFP